MASSKIVSRFPYTLDGVVYNVGSAIPKEVYEKHKPKLVDRETDDDDFETDLPSGFPARSAFAKLEMNQADVDALDRDGLVALKGVTEASADKVIGLRPAGE